METSFVNDKGVTFDLVAVSDECNDCDHPTGLAQWAQPCRFCGEEKHSEAVCLECALVETRKWDCGC
jgi:hypothetical protein